MRNRCHGGEEDAMRPSSLVRPFALSRSLPNSNWFGILGWRKSFWMTKRHFRSSSARPIPPPSPQCSIECTSAPTSGGRRGWFHTRLFRRRSALSGPVFGCRRTGRGKLDNPMPSAYPPPLSRRVYGGLRAHNKLSASDLPSYACHPRLGFAR